MDVKMEIDNLAVLPRKLANEKKIRNADSAKVVLNAYRMSLKIAVETVYKYELKMTASTEQGKLRELYRGAKNDVSKSNRHRLLWELFQQMLIENSDFFGSKKNIYKYTYDCGINFYSIDKLDVKKDGKEFSLEREKLSDESKAYIGGRISSIKAKLICCESSTDTEEINLKDFEAIDETRDRSAIQFLEVLTNQELIRKDDYYIFASKMFEKKSNIRLQNDPRILKDGMQKNVRYIGDSVKDALPIVQLDPKKSAFFPEITIDRFLNEFLPGRDPLDVKIFRGNSLRTAMKQIKSLTVITKHLKDRQRTFVLDGLTNESAETIKFTIGDKSISVADYFKTTYSLRIQYPHLPCAIEKCRRDKNASPNFYPLEVLKIVAGQRVPLSKQTPQLTEQMIRNCQALPSKFRDLMQTQKSNAHLNDRNPYLKEHKVVIDQDLIIADAEVLFPPSIVYERDRVEPDQKGFMQWKMFNGRRFLLPASCPKIWSAVIVNRGVPANECQEFIKRIVNSANGRGMQLDAPKRYETFGEIGIEFIRERFKFFQQNKCGFVMFFTKDKLDPVHHVFKLMEIEFGVLTQHVCSQTMQKALGQQGATMVLDNILMKTNLKLGGVNYGISTAKVMENQLHHDIVGKEWLHDNRMFIGIDVSHAAPQTLYDREAGVPCTDPTIIGMAYTVGHAVKMLGTYWMQDTRVAYVQCLKEKVVNALVSYSHQKGTYPRQLVVFRGGVSEGEYRIILQHEEKAFTDAFEEIGKKSKDFLAPSLTIVVVQRHSNYRIVPEKVDSRARPADQNVRPGTCMDQETMNPSLTDFLLVPHKAIQGTAKPIRCTVISDTVRDRMSLEEVENVTNCLCYAHGIVTSPVSVPAPLYAATELSKRGKNNWKIHNNEGDDQSSGKGSFVNDGGDNFFPEASKRLQPTINTKFWA